MRWERYPHLEDADIARTLAMAKKYRADAQTRRGGNGAGIDGFVAPRANAPGIAVPRHALGPDDIRGCAFPSYCRRRAGRLSSRETGRAIGSDRGSTRRMKTAVNEAGCEAVISSGGGVCQAALSASFLPLIMKRKSK